MQRRTFLGAGGATLAAALAGCGGLLETREVGTRAPPVVEDRPAAVYVPTHVEGMEMIGMGTTGRRRVGLMYSFPHRFWTITGTRTTRVDIEDGDAVHLMAAVWDEETGTVLPVGSGLSFDIVQDGESVAERAPWTMLSQNMGFHYGDNFPLPGDGTYTVTVDVGAMGIDRLGAFAGEFGEPGSVEIEFEYSQNVRDGISYRRLENQQGEPGAVDPMEMGMMPLSVAPARGDLPGRVLGEGTSGDATFLATAVERDGPYLAVSPRTPYNGYVMPMMALTGTVARDGETVFDGELTPAIDPDLGYHYGAAVDGVESGDELTVTVDTPPQMSRHEGYETAFVDMPALSLTVQ